MSSPDPQKPSYHELVAHYEACFEKYGDNHLGVDWPNLEDLFTRYQVMLDVARKEEAFSLLDFGCGTGMLYQYILDQQYDHIDYSGLDLGATYVEKSRSKFPDRTFYQTDILEQPEAVPAADFIVMNGVLTEKRGLSFEDMWDYTQKLLAAVFQKARKGIAFNVMSKAVDWERDDLFHLSTDVLITYLTQKLSRHFIIRNDYGLYEYTVYLYHEPWQKS